jgi:hypothetical protein
MPRPASSSVCTSSQFSSLAWRETRSGWAHQMKGSSTWFARFGNGRGQVLAIAGLTHVVAHAAAVGELRYTSQPSTLPKACNIGKGKMERAKNGN